MLGNFQSTIPGSEDRKNFLTMSLYGMKTKEIENATESILAPFEEPFIPKSIVTMEGEFLKNQHFAKNK